MAAVGEAAFAHKLLHVRKGIAQSFGYLPHPQLPHTGRVDDQHTAFEPDQLPVGGGVAAFGIALPDAVDRHDLLPCQGIDQAGLADTGGAEKYHRLSRLQIGVQPLQSIPGMGADHMGIHPRGHPLHPGQMVPVVLHQIRLGQQDHGGGTGLPCKGQIPLQPPGIEVQIQRLHEEHIVKIRRHRLIPGDGSRLPAGEEGPPGQCRGNQAVAVVNVMDHDIVACGGEILGACIVFFGFQAGMGSPMGADDLIALLVNRSDPGRDARQILRIRHDAVIVQIQDSFPPNSVW